MKSTKKCYGCGESFPRAELIDVSSPSGKTYQSYCPVCHEKKMARDLFSNKVCEIFGLKAPGPRIWTERKRIKDKYGFTDEAITECLEYLYKIEKNRKFAESLVLVTPEAMERMWTYYERRQVPTNGVDARMATNLKPQTVHIKENTTAARAKIDLNSLDD